MLLCLSGCWWNRIIHHFLYLLYSLWSIWVAISYQIIPENTKYDSGKGHYISKMIWWLWIWLINTLLEKLCFCLIILISCVLLLWLLKAIPFILIVFPPFFYLLIMHRCNIIGSLTDSRIIHVFLLRILQSLISLLEQFKLLKCLFTWIMIWMI